MNDDAEDGPFVSDPFVLPLLPARQTPEEEGDAARRFMDWAGWGMRTLGLDGAADNLARYRSGQGGSRDYGDDEIARYPILLRAEDRNRTQFESQTFMAEMGAAEKNARLRQLADGETYGFEDAWDRALFQSPWDVANLLTYLTFGKTGVTSRGTFEATRRGDTLQIRGTVAHGFPHRERFDFHEGQPGAEQAQALEADGEALPFGMAYDRRQAVEAVSQYEPDGRLMLLRSTWGPIR